MNMKDIANIRPSRRQYGWQKLEFYGFIHFGITTMTGREWGLGHEELSLFNPRQLDAAEWVKLLQEAGMKAVILTCKHHDGFCLWPSRYTEHTVANTPWRNGSGDLVKEVAEACREQGLKFGVYLSPWDRTESSYGEGKAYDDFYVQQLTELLTNYGEIGCVWLDGANGEGPSGKKQYYDWDRYYETVRRLQPQCVISVCGPDIRWVGNEAGHTRKEEWSVVPRIVQDAEKIAEKSQHADDGEFSRSFNSMDEDLGSRSAIAGYDGEWVWYPAEVNTSIRPGWFYHEEEDSQVRSDRELFEIYLNAVGGNTTFLLNIPPDKDGIIAEPDREVLRRLGKRIAALGEANLAQQAAFTVSSSEYNAYAVKWLAGEHSEACWKPVQEDLEPWVELAFSEQIEWNTIILQEHILLGQRVEAFEIWSADPGGWQKLAEGTVIGYKKIIRVPQTSSTHLKLVFKEFREFPTLAQIRILNIQNDA
ncbi:alpha-L-fucosidase [Paenibacillus donghaensis]|uniref:alpha-L-fucosidase n=1 Tax=Paenibacillus donghaensis TaxID=414771 RepID=A0A2Z2KEG1_9BACL|nr:alpha-L-fucosidase [Paenibacillus donghaensis]ASA20429.1 alpha-L-fucosidase [Paenibacillus donghaensis]